MPKDFDLEKELGEFAYSGPPKEEDDLNETLDKMDEEERSEDEGENEGEKDERKDNKDNEKEETDSDETEDEDNEEEKEQDDSSETGRKTKDDKYVEKLQAKIAILEDTVDSFNNKLEKFNKDNKDEPEEFEIDSMSDDEFEKITESKEDFVNFLGNTLKKAVEFSREQTLKSMPSLVDKKVEIVNRNKQLAKDFYEKNPDLYEFKEYVGRTANKISSKNPDLDFPKILKETEREVRSRLGVKSKKSRGFPKIKSNTRRSSGKKKLSGFDKEFDELSKVM